jgi:NAD(P)-dependent dehydrogenase (short-subunit alcohol dehydrogenase family)
MENVKVWFITGAGRGMGVSFTRAVLDGGHAVVATGRRPGEVADAVGASDRLLVAALDVTSTDECAAALVEDYAARSAAQREWWSKQDGAQAGDPGKLAAALLAIADEDPPPRRFIAGADVIALARRKINELDEDINSYRELSESLTFDP